MKYLPTIAGVLLGLLFVMSAVVVLFNLVPPPKEPMPEAATTFMTLFMSTGWMTFVKIFELIGGILVAIPRTRNLGLLVLGPIILNILAFNVLIMKGAGLMNPMTAIIVVIPLYLLWVERKAFAGLVNR